MMSFATCWLETVLDEVLIILTHCAMDTAVDTIVNTIVNTTVDYHNGLPQLITTMDYHNGLFGQLAIA